MPLAPAVQVDEVVDAASRSEQVLGEGAEARVVVGEHRQADGILNLLRERHLAPAEVRGPAHGAVGGAYEPGDREADRGHVSIAGGGGDQVRDHRGDDRDGRVGVGDAVDGSADAALDARSEADDRGGHGIHLGVDGDDDGARIGLHPGRRPADPAARDRLALAQQSHRLEFCDEGGDGRAVESGERCQFRARGGATVVHVVEDRREVSAADAIDLLPGWHGHHPSAGFVVLDCK